MPLLISSLGGETRFQGATKAASQDALIEHPPSPSLDFKLRRMSGVVN